MQLADRIAARNDLDAQWTRRIIGSARVIEPIKKLVLPPPESGQKKNWNAYRARFVEPTRIRAGVRFRDAHLDALQRAEQQFGVPAGIIVGVLGMETLWGQQTGKIRVLDALATLAIDFPREHPRAAARSEYFVQELEQFLLLMHHSDSDPRTPRGSYAGDMGMPQFMPSSWARYGVDFNNDGHIDLWNAEDAIGSVANYLQGHGWMAGLPVYYRIAAGVSEPVLRSLGSGGLAPRHSIEALHEQGISLVNDQGQELAPHSLAELRLALVELENRSSPSLFVAATGNLQALTRYNPSRYYAMAVTELGAAIAAVSPQRSQGR
ncbi:lytic murein transglycosylase B [Diaphorobacter aerolatus]|uniref:Lytic murein transglycosylase B n=2 Tax=Diaphorobacter aerolatus TaxID=1288495 RepID=A0A7H0GQ45_9BURK|nr:lytic murein transglycosylase B [Diaphorobacter aerolatus]